MSHVKLIAKDTKKCESCGKYGYYTYFFKWYSIVTDDYLCTICFKCARRELFGAKYKYNKRYYVWLEKLKEQ